MGLLWMLIVWATACSKNSSNRDGSEGKPLVVMLLPSETGSKNALDDYTPLFDAITRVNGIHFDLKMGDSYNAVVEGIAVGHIDLSFFGAVTFDAIQRRGAGELLAIEQTGGSSVYYAGIFHRKDSGMTGLADLKGKSIALGDPKSTSSFRVPLAELIKAGIDPVRDVGRIVMAGSHTASLEQLEAGHVAGAGAAINAYNKVVEAGAISGQNVVLLARSDPIPSPMLIARSALSTEVKDRLRSAFGAIHRAEGVQAEMLLGYGGKKIDRFNIEFDPQIYDHFMRKLNTVTEELIDEIIEKAGKP